MVSAPSGHPDDDGEVAARSRPRAVAGGARVFSKGSLVALAHGIEASLLDAEPDEADLPVVFALFQREHYFSPERRRYRAIARNSLVTVVGFVDADPDVPTPIVGVSLLPDEELAQEFALIIISKCICVSLIGTDLGNEVEERNRRFETRWSFDRVTAVQEARRLLEALGDRVPAAQVAQVEERLVDAEQAVPRRIEARLTAAFEQMVKRYQWVAGRVNQLEDERAIDAPSKSIGPLERDALTRLPRRRDLARFVGQLMIDSGAPQVAVAWLDINDLEAINTRYGRSAGDAALQVVASAVKSHVRDEDCLVRWGDDEFVVVMLGMDIAAAKLRALEFVEQVAKATLPEPFRGIKVTISCDVAVGDVAALALNTLRENVNRRRARNHGRTTVGGTMTAS